MTEECKQSFEGLKSRLMASPVLAYANFALPFILEVNASYSGLGAVLLQQQDGKVNESLALKWARRSVGLPPGCWSQMPS